LQPGAHRLVALFSPLLDTAASRMQSTARGPCGRYNSTCKCDIWAVILGGVCYMDIFAKQPWHCPPGSSRVNLISCDPPRWFAPPTPNSFICCGHHGDTACCSQQLAQPSFVCTGLPDCNFQLLSQAVALCPEHMWPTGWTGLPCWVVPCSVHQLAVWAIGNNGGALDAFWT
jgi:hypothetical protein